jgi:hypothetical protein
VVFVEDYDMKVAREMVQGVDLWLNNPRRGEEACGTSGMKAAINGVLNLSILDGWFDEAYEHSGGWAIGDREPYSDDQDALHASAIYYLLENEIVPMFLRAARADAARVGAAHEAIADVHYAAVRLPAHGAEYMDRSCTSRLTSSTCALWPGDYQPGPRQGALERTRAGGLGPRAVRGFRRRPPGSWISGSRCRCARPSTWPGCSRRTCAWKW